MKTESIRRIIAIIKDQSESFTYLAKLGRLDPATSFCGADLSQVDFGTDDLSGFRFHRADLSGANLAHARNLHPSMFEGIIFNDKTRWPSRFDIQTITPSTNSSQERKDAPSRQGKIGQKIRWDKTLYWKYHDSYEYAAALEYCQNVKRQDPNNLSANVFEAHLLGSHFGKPDEGIRILEAAIKRTPLEPNLHFFMAEMLKVKNDLIGAESELRQALEFINISDNESRARVMVALADLLINNITHHPEDRITEIDNLIRNAEKMNVIGHGVPQKINLSKSKMASLKKGKKSWLHKLRSILPWK